MPGLVKIVSVSKGDIVEKGQALAVMEAMKMEHTLRASRDGTIADVNILAASPTTSGRIKFIVNIQTP